MSETIQDMQASVTVGSASTQTIPNFLNTYEQQGRGSCGDRVYSIAQVNGSSVASFLSVSGSELTLQSLDTGLIGEY